jgi:hypothetical protein
MQDEKTWKDLHARLVARAWQDEDFKRRLLADATPVLAKEFGIALPPGMTVKVVEQTPTTICLVLPMKPVGDSALELDDEALDAVAGGIGSCCCCGGKSQVFDPRSPATTLERLE